MTPSTSRSAALEIERRAVARPGHFPQLEECLPQVLREKLTLLEKKESLHPIFKLAVPILHEINEGKRPKRDIFIQAPPSPARSLSFVCPLALQLGVRVTPKLVAVVIEESDAAVQRAVELFKRFDISGQHESRLQVVSAADLTAACSVEDPILRCGRARGDAAGNTDSRNFLGDEIFFETLDARRSVTSVGDVLIVTADDFIMLMQRQLLGEQQCQVFRWIILEDLDKLASRETFPQLLDAVERIAAAAVHRPQRIFTLTAPLDNPENFLALNTSFPLDIVAPAE